MKNVIIIGACGIGKDEAINRIKKLEGVKEINVIHIEREGKSHDELIKELEGLKPDIILDGNNIPEPMKTLKITATPIIENPTFYKETKSKYFNRSKRNYRKN